MPDKYVFIDRDGVINVDGENLTEHGYITRWEDFRFLPGAVEAFRDFTEAGYRTVIISNQQCVSKGLLAAEELSGLTSKMLEEIRKNGGSVAGVYYCPHHRNEYCACRKPESGLFLQAGKDLGIKSFSGYYFIGDSERDMIAGKKLEMGTILVLSGKSRKEDVLSWEQPPDHICKDLLEAAELIIKKDKEGRV
ncbi:MAG: HAD-IIIA family hydrolase [Candidatus Omnitrophica bacterium]|nr:HAD-IIIA family hydrolase [Candidatus Omnitrophota bacterium]